MLHYSLTCNGWPPSPHFSPREDCTVDFAVCLEGKSKYDESAGLYWLMMDQCANGLGKDHELTRCSCKRATESGKI